MKTLTYFLLISMFLFAISCSKKDSIDKNSLNGTTWTYKTNNDNYVTLKFTSKNSMSIVGKADGDRVTGDGTYNYDSPDISMNFEIVDIDGDIETYKGIGTVIGNEMTVDFDFTYVFEGTTYKEEATVVFRKD